MQGIVRSQVEMCSEVHPAILLVRDGISMLPPESEMHVKQFYILILNAALGRGMICHSSIKSLVELILDPTIREASGENFQN